MATPPQGTDLLQGHFTMPAYHTGVLAGQHGGVKTTSQVRHDNVAGSSSTSWATEVDITGVGCVTVLSTNPASTYQGRYRLTIDGVALFDHRAPVGHLLVGLTWLSDITYSSIFTKTYGPIYFNTSMKLETAQVSTGQSFTWNFVYQLLTWG